MGGIWVGSFLLLLYMCAQGSMLFATDTMVCWAEHNEQDQTNTNIIVTLVTMFALVMLFSTFHAHISLRLTLCASQRLHNHMAAAVWHAKIEVFKTNPAGHILNQFNADIGIVNDQLPQPLLHFCYYLYCVWSSNYNLDNLNSCAC